MDEITIVVVDDHPLFRQGVMNTLALEAAFRVVGEAANGREALELIRRVKPDVAIVDINLPGMNGQQLTHHLTQGALPTRVLLLTAYDDGDQVRHAAWSGARGYCSKDVNPAWLKRTVLEIMKGNYVMGDRVMTRQEFEVWLAGETMKAQCLYSEPGAPFYPLSNREMEVLGHIVRGLVIVVRKSPFPWISVRKLSRITSHLFCANSGWRTAHKQWCTLFGAAGCG